MKNNYHIEYDLPLDQEGDDLEKVKALAGYIEYIMDDIIHDLGLKRYQPLFYYLTDIVILGVFRRLLTEEETKDV